MYGSYVRNRDIAGIWLICPVYVAFYSKSRSIIDVKIGRYVLPVSKYH